MTTTPDLSRRALVAGLGLTALAGAGWPGRPLRAAARKTGPVSLANPLIRQRADAQVFRDPDGNYYMTGSVPEYDRLVLRRATTLAGLATAPETVVWRRPRTGKLGGYIWAPELHRLGDRWILYFAAGDSDDKFHIRTYALRGTGADPLTARWEMAGQLQTPWDSFTLDSTLFVHKGVPHLCWAQKEPGIDTNSNLYLAPLATATTLARAPVRLTVPTLPWEIQGFKVNEAPALLAHDGRLFLTYSASATDARYCLGMLRCDADADILRADAWTKSPDPVFVSNAATGVYGPGHNSFTVDERGRAMLVYHGRDYRDITGDPLFDPNRHTRVQRLYFGRDGTPDFGVPVGNGPLPVRLGPAGGGGAGWLRHRDGRLDLSEGPLPDTQFRLVPQAGGTVTLEPILTRGRAVAVPSASGAPVERFRVRPGLSDPRALSLAAADRPGAYLLAAADGVRIAPVRTAADRAHATLRQD